MRETRWIQRTVVWGRWDSLNCAGMDHERSSVEDNRSPTSFDDGLEYQKQTSLCLFSAFPYWKFLLNWSELVTVNGR